MDAANAQSYISHWREAKQSNREEKEKFDILYVFSPEDSFVLET